MKAMVEIIRYRDHAQHDNCADLKQTFDQDTILISIGAVVRETQEKVWLLSEWWVNRVRRTNVSTHEECRVDEIIASAIISRVRLKTVDLEGFECLP
jgi:hypothetical protein